MHKNKYYVVYYITKYILELTRWYEQRHQVHNQNKKKLSYSRQHVLISSNKHLLAVMCGNERFHACFSKRQPSKSLIYNLLYCSTKVSPHHIKIIRSYSHIHGENSRRGRIIYLYTFSFLGIFFFGVNLEGFILSSTLILSAVKENNKNLTMIFALNSRV